jgi:ribosomal protein L36
VLFCANLCSFVPIYADLSQSVHFCANLCTLCQSVLFCASFVQPLCSLFSDIKTCAGFVPVLCSAQKRHKMSFVAILQRCAYSVPFLCLVCATFVLTLFRHKDLCRFCASSVQGTKKAQNELCLLCACFVPICAYSVLVFCLAQNRHKQE